MYKDKTDEISGYRLRKKDNLLKAQEILTHYLKSNKLFKRGRDMTKEGDCFAKNSAFYDVFVANGLLNEWYKPIYADISLSKNFMKSIGFKTTKDDGIFGEAKDIKSNGMTIINWNRNGRIYSYFGKKLDKNIDISIKKDGGTRTAFDGYIFCEHQLKELLELTW